MCATIILNFIEIFRRLYKAISIKCVYKQYITLLRVYCLINMYVYWFGKLNLDFMLGKFSTTELCPHSKIRTLLELNGYKIHLLKIKFVWWVYLLLVLGQLVLSKGRKIAILRPALPYARHCTLSFKTLKIKIKNIVCMLL